MGGDCEAGVAIGAKEKNHRMGKSIQGVMGSVLGCGSLPLPGEGQPGARVYRGRGVCDQECDGAATACAGRGGA